MRAPKRKRPPKREIGVPPGLDLKNLASRVEYVGSPEHKDSPSFAGWPKPRSDASICDRRFHAQQTMLTQWLQDAIGKGVISTFFEDQFPRYVWYFHEGTVYEARLLNKVLGKYKGYALLTEEWPKGLVKFYA